MRNTFVNTLCEIAQNDRRICLVTGDLGFGVLTKFWETYPEQFINAGISEQNMTSVAAGMALEGKIVFTYSIANFPTLRCLEQIRNDVAYHSANVKIVSVGAGFAYGGAGMSHYATEDLAIMRALPGITVFSPADPMETVEVIKAAVAIDGPCYIRLGKGGERNLHEPPIAFMPGRALRILDGDKVCLFATGAITSEAKEAAISLNSAGIGTALFSFPTIKPIDSELIKECAARYDLIVTVEEHNVVGGFGSAVAEVISGLPCRAVLNRIGLNDVYPSIVGTQEYLRDYYGMSSKSIEEAVLSFYKVGCR
jgi:transketolase